MSMISILFNVPENRNNGSKIAENVRLTASAHNEYPVPLQSYLAITSFFVMYQLLKSPGLFGSYFLPKNLEKGNCCF